MDLNRNYIKKQIYLWGNRKDSVTPEIQGYEMSNDVVQGDIFSDNVLVKQKDIYVNVFLTKTCEIFEYVDVKKDEKIYSIDRQLINPYYINFGFFETVRRIKINTEEDLTMTMKNYLKIKYPESISEYNNDVEKWFNEIGYNILINDVTTIIDKVTGKKIQENGLDKLEKLKPSLNSVISKSHYFPIDVNK